MLSGPGFMAQPGEIYSQLSSAAAGLGAVEELNQSVLVTTQTVGEAEQIRLQAVTRINRLVGSLQVSVIPSSDKVSNGRQDPPFIVAAGVSTDQRGASVGVPQTPVEIIVGEGSAAQTRTVWTDEGGTARWEFHEIAHEPGTMPITAKVLLPESLRTRSEFASATPQANAAVEVVSRLELVKLLVALREESFGYAPEHFAEARLLEALTEAGFNVVSPTEVPNEARTDDPWSSRSAARSLAQVVEADLLLTGTVQAEQPAPVERIAGIYFTRANVELALVEVGTGRALATITLPDDVVADTKGFGNTEQRAVMDAFSLTRGVERSRQPNGYVYLADQIRRALTSIDTGGP